MAFLVLQSFFIAHLLTNLSRLRRAQDALVFSEDRLHTIYEAANRVAFVMTDSQEPDGRITEFSLGAERMFGYTRAEILGKPVSVL
jgi:PAS domain-containing protein